MNSVEQFLTAPATDPVVYEKNCKRMLGITLDKIGEVDTKIRAILEDVDTDPVMRRALVDDLMTELEGLYEWKHRWETWLGQAQDMLP